MLAGEFLDESHFSSISRMLSLTDEGCGFLLLPEQLVRFMQNVFLRSFHDVVSIIVAMGKGLK